MTDQQPQDGAREIIAITAAATDEAGVNAYEVAIAEGWTDIQPEWLVVADAVLSALKAANMVIVDAERLVSLEHLADVVFAWRNLPEHADDLEALTSLIDAADAVGPLPAAGEKGGE